MTIKDGYISFINERELEESIWLGGFELIEGRPKQIKVNTSMIRKEIRNLENRGCKVTLAEICIYDVENNEYAELIDPIKRISIK